MQVLQNEISLSAHFIWYTAFSEWYRIILILGSKHL